MAFLHEVSDWVWSETFWLPKNTTWADLEKDDSIYIPKVSDLLIPFPLAFVLFSMRLVWERYIAYPIGKRLHVKTAQPRKAIPNATLESYYRQHKRTYPSHEVAEDLAKKIDWTPRQINRWWRWRKVQGKLSQMERFKESCWRFSIYLALFLYGFYVLCDKPWFWDPSLMWNNHPHQHVPAGIRWYYMVELGFYWSLVLTISKDTKRKDFKEMMVHHLVTIALITLSYVANLVRFGTLVMLVHDVADPFIELAKMFNYAKYKRSTDCIAMMFAIVFTFTRTVIFPVRIIYQGLFISDYWKKDGFPVFRVLLILILILLILNILWVFILVKVAYGLIMKGQTFDKDARSDTEPESNSEDEAICEK